MNVLFLVPLVCMIVIYMISFQDGKQVCDNYILVSYLYTLFYLSLVACGVKASMDNKWWNMSIMSFIGLFISTIAVQLIMLSTPREYMALKHVLSVVFSLLLSLIISSAFVWYAPSSIVMALVATMILFVSLTILAWKFQEYISSKVTLTLLILFVTLIVSEFFIGMYFPNTLLEKGIILVVLMAISYLVLVKTKRMIENEKKCESEGPDYVNEGTGLMLTFENLFLQLLRTKKLK